MQVHQCLCLYIYNYIYIFMHMDMAYATTMLPILQGALETSVFTWKTAIYMAYIYIHILCTCGKIIDIVYYQIWNYFLTKHKHYMMFMHQIKQWRPSLYLLKEKKNNNRLSPYKACWELLFRIVLYVRELNKFFKLYVFLLGSCSCHVMLLLMLRHAIVLLATCLIYICKVLSIWRRIL